MQPEPAKAPTLLLEEGRLAFKQGRWSDALICFERALARAPDSAAGHYHLGRALLELSRFDEAEASFRRSISLKPEVGSGYHSLGAMLVRQGRDSEGELLLAKALAIEPRVPSSLHARGAALVRLGRAEEALACSEAALAFDAEQASPHSLRGTALLNLRRPHEAIQAFRRALELDPRSVDALSNLGLASQMVGDLDDALLSYDRAIEHGGTNARLLANKAVVQLKLGDLEVGWKTYEHRQPEVLTALRAVTDKPYWLGDQPLSGRTILIVAELGLGDTIQFCRYIPLLEQSGATVLFAAQKPLRPLMKGLTPNVRLVENAAAAPPHDYVARLLSLPIGFGVSPGAIPASVPYLAADPQRVERWRGVIGSAGFKIAVSWRGSDGGVASGRSFPLAMMQRLASIPKVRLISLQKGRGEEELQTLPAGMAVERLPEFDDDGAFLDSAAVLQLCDLAITCDTALGHLAGALDRPTWLALPQSSDWRWLTERTDTPWYPSHRLFRQTAFDDWTGVFAAMEPPLLALAAGD